MAKWLKRIALLAVLLIACGALYFVFVSPYKLYVVHTGSMGNTIPSRSALVVHESHFHTGQVVTFYVHGEVVTHRLLKIEQDGTITTKGDANRTADPWHPTTHSIIGGVVSAPRGLGWWLVFLRQPTGLLSVVLFLVAFWLFWKSDQKQPGVLPVPATA